MWARRGITCGSVVMSGLFSPCAAQTVPVSIPAQPVESAIVALGKVAHVQIIGVRRQISGKNARAVDGVMDTRQALDRLLAGTGLMVRQSGPATFVIVEEPASVPRRRPASPEPIKPPAPIMPSVPALTMANAQIIVTGSRLISNGNNLPTPVTALSSAELLENDPSSLIAAIYELPALLGSISLTSNINTGGLNAINLRGIGVNRSLLMVDARRAGPTSGENTINPDIVPQILLQRVDVVTGGGSAIYGSDAVAGVVNFVTDKEFNGFKAHVQNGISTYGDDNKFDIGAAWGGGFAQGRGHLVLGAQWRESVGITSRQVRPFTANTIWSEQGSVPGGGTPGSVGNPYKLTQGAVLGNASFGGLINSGPLAGLQFASNGLLSTFHHGTPTGTPGVEVGGDGAYFVDSSLSAWQKLHNSYARADFDITPDIGLFGTLAYSHFRQGYQGQNPYLNGIEISFANPFLSTIQPEYRAIIAQQSPEATMRISKIAAELPNYSMQYQQSYYQATLGIKGKAGPAGWNADYSHSDSHLTLSNLHDINTGRLMAALDAIGDGKGGAVCRAAILNPGKYGQCVPLNIFGPSAASQPAIDYISQATHASTRVQMDNLNATMKGKWGDMGAGPVTYALDAEWRRVAYGVNSTASGNDLVDCAGIAYNCNASSVPYLSGATAARSPVSQTVAEGAVEIDAPLLRRKPWAQDLGINFAMRMAHYNTSGNALSWKLSGRWRINDDIRLRATRSRDIRAPSLADLFAPQVLYRKTLIDAHTNSSGFVSFITQGNPSLRPEKADTITLGAVITPRAIPGLSVALDYYRIAIGNAIVQFDGYQPGVSALCEASNGAADVCRLIVRPLSFADRSAANFPTQLLSETLNAATARTWGVDFEMNYSARVLNRPLVLRVLANWQPHVLLDNGPSGILDVGGAADGSPGLPALPSTKILASIGYQPTRALWVRLRQRWRSSLRPNGNEALHFVDGNIAPTGYSDVLIDYRVNANSWAYLNVKNLFNTWPQPYASSGGSGQMNYLGGFVQGDDIEGRYFTVGMRVKL